MQKNVVIARLKGVADRNAAELLNGVSLFLDRSRLPQTDDEDDFYHADLLGLEARLEDGTVIGTVTAIPNFGAGDLIEIRDQRSGDTYLYPFTKAVVPGHPYRAGLPDHHCPDRDRMGRGRRARLSFSAQIITLFPDLFPGPLGASVLGRGLADGLWSLKATHLRDFATDRHRTVDDTPSGGGAGMVLKPDILASAIDTVAPPGDLRPRILMSPRGKPLTQARARELALGPGAVIVCGRFEGVDQRVIEARQLEEISIGDYVLAGGEVAAMVLLEAVVRLIPGVLGRCRKPCRREFRERPAGISPIYPPAELRGRRYPSGPDLGRSRQNRQMAA